jgi:toxin ParE1/3/4
MTGFALSSRAQQDIEDIWTYTAKRWGEDQAETYARLLQAAIQAVAVDRRLGRPCDNIRRGY